MNTGGMQPNSTLPHVITAIMAEPTATGAPAGMAPGGAVISCIITSVRPETIRVMISVETPTITRPRTAHACSTRTDQRRLLTRPIPPASSSADSTVPPSDITPNQATIGSSNSAAGSSAGTGIGMNVHIAACIARPSTPRPPMMIAGMPIHFGQVDSGGVAFTGPGRVGGAADGDSWVGSSVIAGLRRSVIVGWAIAHHDVARPMRSMMRT